ncbi:SPECC1 [Mytilus coruscus]|uniref:SPECC1 n=1 Tax=Mytilus coruscus TaxID=42192 RepID=A0A6J8BS09_MYTCO|nr:SPECC1 [Mytilus coruscus]
MKPGMMERTSTPIRPVKAKPISTTTPTAMKHSHSANSDLSSVAKTRTPVRAVASPLGKPFLSKSHENLSSHQKRKLSAYIDHRPKSSLGIPKGTDPKKSSNKENLNKHKNDGFTKPKPVKAMPLTPIRKASSIQHIDKTSNSSTKTMAAFNRMQSIKRAHSTQNVSKDKLSRKRTSAPADVMAYNAELLANFEKDKKLLEKRISELIQVTENRKAEIEKYKYETKRLKEQIPSHDLKDELGFLKKENQMMKDQLKELGHPYEQITDTEKLSKLQKNNNNSNKSKASEGAIGDVAIPKSMSCDSLSTDGVRAVAFSVGKDDHVERDRAVSMTTSEPGMFFDHCSTPEHPSGFADHHWDKASSKSSDGLSEISVVCLTERILQMEESHYSTNEELQATLQELGDLQHSVNELTDDNEQLTSEKFILLESLCTQTEKLEHCRTQIEQLKALLISGNFPERSEREQQLLELLKCAQEEREELLRKQIELSNALNAYDHEHRELQDVNDALRDKVQLLEDKNSALKAEKEMQEVTIIEFKQSVANEKIEVDHFKTLLENEKTKVKELEQCLKTDNQSELEEVLHKTRQEKDKIEEKLANMKEVLLHTQSEMSRVKEICQQKDEEIKLLKNNSRSSVSSLEFKLDKLEKEKSENQNQNQSLREHIDQLEQDCEQYLNQKKEYLKELKEVKSQLKEIQSQNSAMEAELNEVKGKYCEETEEWKQFQKDLQTAVLVANDFRVETQDDMEQLQHDNAQLKEKCNKLNSEIDRLKIEMESMKSQKFVEDKITSKSILSAELKGKVINTVDKELGSLSMLRAKNDKNQIQSVKTLIRSIEEQVKSGCSSIHSSTSSSRRNSDANESCSPISGMREFHDSVKSPTSPIKENLLNVTSPEVTLRSVLKKADRPPPLRHSMTCIPFDAPRSPGDVPPKSAPPISKSDTSPSITSILTRPPVRRSSGVTVGIEADKKEGASKDPLTGLAKQMGGSKRNALLKWCQQKTLLYNGVDITNFSSSWNDGLAFCALLHSYLPEKIPYAELNSEDKRKNFTLAFAAAESVGINSSVLHINDMVSIERPDWQAVMSYVTSIYKYFEVDSKS